MNDEVKPDLDPEQYPEGKLNEDDKGALQMLIGTEGGCVKVLFREPVSWIGMPPAQAIEFAETIIKRAKELQSFAK